MAPSEPSRRIGKNQFRAISLENPLALGRSVLGQAEFHLITAHRADHGIGDARVAAGGIDQSFVRRQQPGLLALANHVERGAIFYGAAQD